MAIRWLILVVCLAMLSCGVSRPGASPSALDGHQATALPTPIVVEPAALVLGDLFPGQKGHGTAILRNTTNDAITIKVIETTCPCVRTSIVSETIAAEKTSLLAVDFDASVDPEFRGGLAIGLTGRDRRGLALFHTNVQIRVLDQAVQFDCVFTHPSEGVASR